MILSSDSVDPLTAALAPPENETPAERTARELREERALQVSKQIDAELRAAKRVLKKQTKAVRVLVLGQSLSGKTTTIKNFQITYASESWADERASWRAVILLNLVRSVNILVDNLTGEADLEQTTSKDELAQHDPTLQAEISFFNTKHRRTILRLAPLRQIEKDLRMFLGSGSSESDDIPGQFLEPIVPYSTDTLRAKLSNAHEFCVRSTSGWKSILNQVVSPRSDKGTQLYRVSCNVVAGCREDIKTLWADPLTQQIMRKRQLRLEDTPGFFLNDVDRVTAPNYQASDEDIVRARLRTTGVQEYHFTLDKGRSDSDWIMYDVAGIRTMRAAWIPYFKDITAIIFLAPLSSFNENLTENPGVNCLEDTFMLWKTICSSKLLVNVQFILFMNKTDILRRKLEQGVRVEDSILEFRDKPNDFETVSTWFRRIFKKIYYDSREVSRRSIHFYAHFTNVIDTKATAETLAAVRSVIVKNQITEAGLM